VPRLASRPNPRKRGAAYEICPRTPDHLVVEFGSDQTITHVVQGEGHQG
jgi:hypothetical protein